MWSTAQPVKLVVCLLLACCYFIFTPVKPWQHVHVFWSVGMVILPQLTRNWWTIIWIFIILFCVFVSPQTVVVLAANNLKEYSSNLALQLHCQLTVFIYICIKINAGKQEMFLFICAWCLYYPQQPTDLSAIWMCWLPRSGKLTPL